MSDQFDILSYTSDDGVAGRAAIGLVVLSSDQTIEYDYRVLTGALAGVNVFAGRIAMDDIVTPESLAAMETKIPEAASRIMPGLSLDVVAYGCTSASMVLGEQTIFDQIHKVRPGVACTTPITAGFKALRTLGAQRLAVVTPYSDSVNEHVKSYIQDSGGFEVNAFGSFKEEDDRRAARIDEASIRDAAVSLGQRDDVDGVFVSCTSLRTANIVADVERQIGKPVTGSNHAMAWHSLRLAGVEDRLPQFGRLFEA